MSESTHTSVPTSKPTVTIRGRDEHPDHGMQLILDVPYRAKDTFKTALRDAGLSPRWSSSLTAWLLGAGQEQALTGALNDSPLALEYSDGVSREPTQNANTGEHFSGCEESSAHNACGTEDESSESVTTDDVIPVGPSARSPEERAPGEHDCYASPRQATDEELSREFDGDLKLLTTGRSGERAFVVAHESYTLEELKQMRERILEHAPSDRSRVYIDRDPAVDGVLIVDAYRDSVLDWLDDIDLIVVSLEGDSL